MTRLPLRTFISVLAALCLISAGTAGGMARAAMAIADAGGAQIVICGTQGAELIDLPGAPASGSSDCDLCPACQMTAGAPLPATAPAMRPRMAARIDVATTTTQQYKPRPAAAHMARAPPKDV